MNGKYETCISRLEEIAREKNKILRYFPVICVGALRYLEHGDIKGFADKLDERQILLDNLAVLNDKFSSIRENLSEGYGTILGELAKSGAENMVCPDWCKSLQIMYFETRKLMRACRILNKRLNTQAVTFQKSIIQNIYSLRNREKVRSVYLTVEKVDKGSAICCKSN